MSPQAWADSAVKREIANLVVRCNNYEVGCVWTGVFKDLMVCTAYYNSRLSSMYCIETLE